MSNTLFASEPEMFPNRYRLPVEAYYRLRELGFLEGCFEILDGEVISKRGQNPPHSSILTRLFRILAGLFGADYLRMQSPIVLSGTDSLYNEPEPDAAVTRETENAYNGRHPGPEDLLLVVEISDTTLRTDLIVKARLYARAGIIEYWALDLNARQLHIHRAPANGEYTTVTVHAETETIAFASHPEVPIVIADLLPAVSA
jgi:Uma2 family endonuclease